MNVKKFLLIFCCLVAFKGLSHGGRTDASGGHNCSAKSIKKGSCSGYHYHNLSSKSKIYKYNKKLKTNKDAIRRPKDKIELPETWETG